MFVFGPIPSRRLGRSLGINNIPKKNCTYSCIYCQVGNTNKMVKERNIFYNSEIILDELNEKLALLEKKSEKVDYISIVPDGEPTLDSNLGYLIKQIKLRGYKTAVITNSSLLQRKVVREDLKSADLISVKIDAVDEDVWKKINRPHGKLILRDILVGVRLFAFEFEGTLFTETMLVKGVNDSLGQIISTAQFIKSIDADRSFILTPLRPPSDIKIESPSSERIEKAKNIFSKMGIDVEVIVNSEGNDFSFLENVREEILSITAVHPMTEEAMEQFLQEAESDWGVIDGLLKEKKLSKKVYSNKTFFIKN